MASRKEKVNAGLFLLIGVLLLSATIALVAGLNLDRPGDRYSIRISKSVGGLREGSIVKYLGVPVGRVRDVDFPKDDVASVNVEIEITKPSTPIHAGTYATLASNFLTGETTIELLGGSNDEPRLRPGSIVTWKPTTLMRLEDSLPGVLDELKKVVNNVNELFGAANQSRVAKLVDDLDSAVLAVEGKVDPLARDVRELKERLAAAGDRIADEAGGLRADVNAQLGSGVADMKAASRSVEAVTAKLAGVADNLGKGTAGIEALVASLQRAIVHLDQTLGGADTLVDDNRDELRRTLAALHQSSTELEELLTTLRRDPSTLLFADPPPERVREEGPPGRKGGDR